MSYSEDALHLASATGFAHRGEWLHSLLELEALSLETQRSECVLSLKVQIFCGLEKWSIMKRVAETLVMRYPQRKQWIVALACANRLNGSETEAASLLAGFLESPPSTALAMTLHQFATYACSLGEATTAEVLLKQAIAMHPALLELVREDPGTKLVRGTVRQWL